MHVRIWLDDVLIGLQKTKFDSGKKTQSFKGGNRCSSRMVDERHYRRCNRVVRTKRVKHDEKQRDIIDAVVVRVVVVELNTGHCWLVIGAEAEITQTHN